MARTNTPSSLSRSIQTHLARQKSVEAVREPTPVEGPFGHYPQLGGGERFLVEGINGEMLRIEIISFRHACA